MATREINLFKRIELLSPDELKLKTFTRRFVPIILGLFIIVVVGVLYMSFVVSGELTKLDTDIINERNRIDNLKRSESLYLLLKQKASVLSKVINSQYPYNDQIEFFKSLEPEGTKLKNMELDETGKLSLQMSLVNSASMEKVVDKIVAQAHKKFRQVELDNVRYEEGVLAISFQIDTKSLDL